MADKTLDQRKQEAIARQSILAPENITAPTSQQLSLQRAQNIESTSRVNQPSDRLTATRTRSVSEDVSNVQQLQKILTAASGLDSTVNAGDNLTPESNVIAASGSSSYVKNSADVVRSLERLQRSCNHVFSSVTGKCKYCGKLRS